MPKSVVGHVSLHRFCSCFSGIVFLLGASSTAAVPVDGDGATLTAVRDGLATAAAQHRRGAIVAKVVERGTVDHDLDIHRFVWDGERRYWNYSGTAVYHVAGQPEITEAFSDVELIRAPRASCVHNPTLQFATQRKNESPADADPIQDVLILDPARCWYSFERKPRSWEWMLDPQQVEGFVSRFEVRREPPERLIVERYQTEGAGLLEVEISLAHGGNIVSYHAEADNDDMIYSGTYGWTEFSPGQWRLREAVQQRVRRADPETPFWTYRIEVLEFDPQPEIRADRFEFSSFSLSDGTRVSIRDAQGEKVRGWVVGREHGSPAPVDQKRLDELAGQLREGGFAVPGRER
jgi:hypothetical protein